MCVCVCACLSGFYAIHVDVMQTKLDMPFVYEHMHTPPVLIEAWKEKARLGGLLFLKPTFPHPTHAYPSLPPPQHVSPLYMHSSSLNHFYT